MHLLDKKFLFSRDVVFHEDIFPYSTSSSPQSFFPPLPPYSDSDPSLHVSSSFLPPTSIAQPFNLSPPSGFHASPPPAASPSPSSSLSPPATVRYPSKVHHHVSYLEDYFCGSAPSFPPTLTSIPTYPRSVCFSTLSPCNHNLVNILDTVLEPSTYSQAALQSA